MAISCEESDGKEESPGADCSCTTTCSAESCLHKPSLNPSPSCTQHQRAAQAPPASQQHCEVVVVQEEAASSEDKIDHLLQQHPPSPSHLHNSPRRLAFSADEVDHLAHLQHPATENSNITDTDTPPPSPSHQLHHQNQLPSSAGTLHEADDDDAAAADVITNEEKALYSYPHEQIQRNLLNMALLITSPPSSKPELRRPPPSFPAPSPPSTSSTQTDEAENNAKACYRHSQHQQGQQASFVHNTASLASSNPFSAAANPLDPNAREFIPIAPTSSSCSSSGLRLQPNQRRTGMVSINQQMGSLNLEVGTTNSVKYEPAVQPNHEQICAKQEMAAAFYNMGPAISEVGYHIPCTGEVGFHNSQEGAYDNHAYSVYQSSSQMGFPVPLHSSSVPPAMAPPPLPLIAPPMPGPPPLPSPPFMCPPAGFMEAQLSSALHIHRQHPSQYGFGNSKEHVSRALLISGLPPHLSEAQLREALESWGPIRAIQANVLPHSLQLMVQFFDLRSARQALRDMQNLFLLHHQQAQVAGLNVIHENLFDEGLTGNGRRGLLCGNVVSAQYAVAWAMGVPDAHNQGTLVLFNVGADVNMQDLRRVFEAYGNVREVREAPAKRQHKFVEFYDIRAAAAAWSALNGQEICGKSVKIEFSRQGGAAARRQKAQDKVHQETIASATSSNAGAQGHVVDPFSWNGDGSSQGLQGFINSGLHHQGWERTWPSQEGFPSQFPLNMCIVNSPNALPLPNVMLNPDVSMNYGSNRFPGNGDGRMGTNVHLHGLHSGVRRGQHVPINFDPESSQVVAMQSQCGGASGIKERHGGGSRLLPKGHTHFKFDEDEIHSHPSNPRTTLMIQNIPNKYSQKMLLSMLDQHCVQFNSNLGIDEPECAYDFMYLPIDFKNKCNLGYAFVNFTTPQATLGFYKTFHGKAWEEFNSRKICGVAFARLQGRSALEEHFRNSRFACDTEEYLPVLFVPARNGQNVSQPRVAVGQSGIVRGCRTSSVGHSYFANEPCKSQSEANKAQSDSNSNTSSACEAHESLTVEGNTHTSEGLNLPPPAEMGA